MIEYLLAHSPDDRILNRAFSALDRGQLICFPTDTTWVVAASPYSKSGVEALYRIKKANPKKHMSLLCHNLSQASHYALISDLCYKLIHRKLPGPYTFILQPTRDIPPGIKRYWKDHQIGIRIPDSQFCLKLLESYNKPILSSSVRSLIFGHDDPTQVQPPIYSYQIEEKLEHSVALILDPGTEDIYGPSSVISFINDDELPVIVREGRGDVTDFLV